MHDWQITTAIRLLEEKTTVDYIVEVTGSNIEQIQKIKNKLQYNYVFK